MFAFEGELSGRIVHADGAVLALPPPGPAAVLMRAGYGAAPIGTGGAPRLSAIDYDGAGGSVSGVAAPRAPVRLVLDGRPVGAGQADDGGRFSVLDLAARAPFGPGPHTVRIESPAGALQGKLVVSPSELPDDAPFRARREADRWRVDWRIPGGGVQTTLVFDVPEARP